MTMADTDQRNRVVLLGAGGAGKSSILKRFLFNTFSEEYKETVEDLYCRKYDLHGTSIKVDFLDTAGNIAFPAMRKLSMSTAHGFILVYSITSQTSFDELKKSWEQIKEERNNYQEIPMVIVGNKVDMENDRQIEKFDTMNWIYSESFSGGFVEVSAKDDLNISEIFKSLLEQSRTGVHRQCEPSAQRRPSANSLDETDTEKAEDWDSDARKFNRSRSLIRRGSKPRIKRSPRHQHNKNDCVIS